MLTEDYCSYEVAKLLKSKGFNDVYSKGDCTAFACTHQMAMKWLRGNNRYSWIFTDKKADARKRI